ncbi:MAG: tetratricopeptide repeat protein, partial [Promethearchaeota archaeon]
GGITFQKAWLYYYEGHLDDAIQLFKKLIEINYPGSYLLPLHFLRIGDSYLTKGELGKALKYFEEGISLFKYDSYNAKLNKGMTYGQIGDLYYQRNELESA